ncbi:MAG: oxygen-dependent protoporphyrinogen oxidase [Methanobacteriota archaeon]|jgi:oxygen-dependent protoporphyrinogen oxidase
MSAEEDVAVVGAGVSGLATVHRLRKRGVDTVCFEADDRPGGIVRTVHDNGRVLELGPQRLRLTPPVEGLVDELGLRDEVREGDDAPLYVYHDGELRVAPLSVGEAVTTNLLSWRGKARVLAEPLTRSAHDGETVDRLLTRKFGREAARHFLIPLYSGLYGTPADEMPAEHSVARALDDAGVGRSVLVWAVKKLLRGRDAPPVFSFDEGLERLTDALYEANADAVHLGDSVEEVNRDGDGYEVVTEDCVTRAGDVVVTTPAPTTAEILEGAVPSVHPLRRLSYNRIGVVHLASGYDGDGVGVLVPDHEDVRVSGFTWNASFLGRDGVFTCYVDPWSFPGMPDADDDELAEVAVDEFEHLTGASAEPLHVHRWVPGMPAYDETWDALDELRPPDGVHLCTNYVERAGVTGRLAHASRVADAIADGRGGG